MTTPATPELLTALRALQTEIAVTIPWDVLHRWANVNPLTVGHYAEIECLWTRVWEESRPQSEPPTVHLYHGAAKLTLVRETTQEDPPAIALTDLAGISTTWQN